MTRLIIIMTLVLTISACKKSENETSPPSDTMYFPPTNSQSWESVTPESLNWDIDKLNELYNYLSTNNTRAFIILKDGKIVAEKYWGKNVLNTAPFDQNTNWYWASAGKSLTAFLVGLAQQEGMVNINNKTSDYLGDNWTSLPLEKENLITVKNQLTMTTGLDYDVPNLDCTDPSCLQFKTDAGNQWYYHNAPYTLLEKVVSNASGITYNQFTDEKLENKIGMDGTWISLGYNNTFWSTPRSAARFGLLILNNGSWDSNEIMTDQNYFNNMVNTSQNLNPSYGYLFWLNGKQSTIFPGFASPIAISVAPNAPSDLIVAMGKNGQIIDIVPSKNIVVIRMGETPDGSLLPVLFHNEMWKKLMAVIE